MTTKKSVKQSQCSSKAVSPLDVALYIPNVIGYIRFWLSIVSFIVAFKCPFLFLTFYTCSFVLDALDGFTARRYNQCSMFGTILDMFVDRSSTCGAVVMIQSILVVPITNSKGENVNFFTPQRYWVTLVAALLLFLDVASHFTRLYATLVTKKKSHKDTSDTAFWLLKKYYSKRMFMGLLCVGQEFSYLFLYAFRFYGFIQLKSQNVFCCFDPSVVGAFPVSSNLRFFNTKLENVNNTGVIILYTLVLVAGPLGALKQLINVEQLVDAFLHLAVADSSIVNKNGVKH